MNSQERQRHKMESLGQLAGGVAHELNNVLQPIFFAIDTIQRRSEGDPLIIESSQKITSCVTRAADIIDDILAFARQDSDRLDFLNINETFDHSLTFAVGLLPKTIIVHVNAEKRPSYWSWINKTDLVRVFTNLLSNAVDAMNNKGDIHVSLKYLSILSQGRSKPDIIGEDLAPGQYACISVRDEGGGLDTTELESIFDPFFTTKDIGEGTGLGLAIVYNIIKNWHGGIEVEAIDGQGTEFSFYIPVYRTGEDSY